jgi:excisionase family DNA binding protein
VRLVEKRREGDRMTDRLLTQKEVCQRLRICPSKLQRLRRLRQIPFVQWGHRTIRFRESAVEAFVSSKEIAQELGK